MTSFVSDLDTPLLALSAHDHFTLRNACEGVHIFGGIGSGKTSGSGKALASAYLRAGMGGLWLCAKPEEVTLALAYAKANGREKSVILFDETQGFNFIDYELARQGLAGIGNVVECLMRVLEAADHATGAGGGKSHDPFWAQSTRQILNYCIPLLYSAHGKVTVGKIIDFVVSAARRSEQYKDDAWCEQSFAAQTLRKASKDAVVAMDGGSKLATFDYWFNQYPAIPDKTRGGILISLSAKLDRFKHGRMHSSFCERTTIVPELTFHGAIVIMAMPALTWNEDGVIGQQLFKFMWQRAVESRNGLAPKHRERPVFLWADEAQYFINTKDDDFLSTCRGSRACVVFLTQTLPTYYAKLGKENSDAADGLVGKFATQVFHQNACTHTNGFASQLIGRGIRREYNGSHSRGTSTSSGMNIGGSASDGHTSARGGSSQSGMQGDSHGANWNSGSSATVGSSWSANQGRGSTESTNRGWSDKMDNIIEPNFFASSLKSGGKPHRNLVTALWFKAGGNFRAAGGNNYMLATFQQ